MRGLSAIDAGRVKPRPQKANSGIIQILTLDVNTAWRYGLEVIESFRCRETERLFERERSRRIPPSLVRVALRKLRYLHRAESLEDLRVPPGNRLEALRGNRKGQHSIRINQQWRICFRWQNQNVYDVEIVDYH